MLVNTLNRYSQLALQINIPINTQLTPGQLDQQSVNIWPSMSWLIWIDKKLVNSWPTVGHDVDGVSVECWSSVTQGVDRVSIKYQTSIDSGLIEDQFRVSIKCINRHSTTDTYSTTGDGMLMECWSSINQGLDRWSIKYRSMVNCGFQSRASIDTPP